MKWCSTDVKKPGLGAETLGMKQQINGITICANEGVCTAMTAAPDNHLFTLDASSNSGPL